MEEQSPCFILTLVYRKNIVGIKFEMAASLIVWFESNGSDLCVVQLNPLIGLWITDFTFCGLTWLARLAGLWVIIDKIFKNTNNT